MYYNQVRRRFETYHYKCYITFIISIDIHAPVDVFIKLTVSLLIHFFRSMVAPKMLSIVVPAKAEITTIIIDERLIKFRKYASKAINMADKNPSIVPLMDIAPSVPTGTVFIVVIEIGLFP